MKTITALAIVCAIVATGGPASAQQKADPLDPLRLKYTWGSIYLTYSNLADLSNILSSQKRPQLEKLTEPAVLDLIASFLRRHAVFRAADGVAFLQIDIVNLRAGYMSVAHYEGAVTQLPWSGDQVRRVALFADRFLGNAAQVATMTERLSLLDEERDLKAAWASLNELKASAFTTTIQAQQLELAFRNAIEASATQLSELQRTEPVLHSELKRFAEQVDKAVAADPNFGGYPTDMHGRHVLAWVPKPKGGST